MTHIKLTNSDIYALEALEYITSFCNLSSETFDILHSLASGAEEAYDDLSYPAQLVYQSIFTKEDA